MNKAERLLWILTYLRSRRTAVTAKALAERLDVSQRTVYRDIQSLVLSGVPIEGEAGVGYLLDADSNLPPLSFTESEIEALLLGVRLVRGWGDDGMIASVEGALTKIRAVLPDGITRRLNQRSTLFLVPDYSRDARVKFSDVIREAIIERTVLNLAYVDVDGNATERQVEPLGLVFWGAAWTLVAWCLLRDDYRLFRLDRVECLSPTGRVFDIENGHSLENYIKLYEPGADTKFWSD